LVLGIKPMALLMHSTTELHPQPYSISFCFCFAELGI
jgi:hypothetical protein